MNSLVTAPHALASTLPLTFELPEITAADLLHSALTPVRSDLGLVERRLRSMLQSDVEGVPEMMAYLIESGGKRIRPILTCLIARACGYSGTDHIPVSCVAELLHTATLYHDDVVDNSTLRRGKQTANHLFGNKITILAGDLMLAQCFSMLMDGGFFTISRALSRTVKQVVEGEILQLKCEGNFDTTLEEYLEIVENKTASLFSWCAQAAGLIAGSSVEKSRLLAKLGYHTGVAFQLVDDLMDFVGNRDAMGKDTLADLSEGKMTLPVLLVLQNHPGLREELKKGAADEKGSFIVTRLAALAREPAIRSACENLIGGHIEAARAGLSSLAYSPYRTSLLSLLEYLAKRDR